jgi:hypothetical protein
MLDHIIGLLLIFKETSIQTLTIALLDAGKCVYWSFLYLTLLMRRVNITKKRGRASGTMWKSDWLAGKTWNLKFLKALREAVSKSKPSFLPQKGRERKPPPQGSHSDFGDRVPDLAVNQALISPKPYAKCRNLVWHWLLLDDQLVTKICVLTERPCLRLGYTGN